jgi:glycosyltransferase involved in cell wall biosynthesis
VGVGEREVVGLFVGSLEAHKDPLVAARAAAAVAAEGGALRLLVAGDGPLRGDVEQLEQSTEGAVRALGFRTDIQMLLKASDFLVLPSLREGFSYAVLEAMAVALPVIVSDAPGNVEAVGDAGIVVGRGDTDGFVDAFRRLLDAETRRRLGERGYERVRRDFGLEEMVGRTREIYGRILAGRG